jgi:hypothetical protein
VVVAVQRRVIEIVVLVAALNGTYRMNVYNLDE